MQHDMECAMDSGSPLVCNVGDLSTVRHLLLFVTAKHGSLEVILRITVTGQNLYSVLLRNLGCTKSIIVIDNLINGNMII